MNKGRIGHGFIEPCRHNMKPKKRCKNHPKRDFRAFGYKKGWRVERKFCKRCGTLLSARQVRSKP